MTTPDAAFAVEGACRCGAVRMRLTARPLMTMACHCRGCQRMTSSAYSLSALAPAEAFTVIRGEAVPGGLSPEAGHWFCQDCSTWMFTRPPGLEDFVNVRSVLLDDPRWTRPFIETCTREKLHWASTPAVHSFEGFPPEQRFGSLMGEFAAGEG